MEISISSHFTYKKIFQITLSPILMMIFTSLYGIVDGYFVSNYAGLDAYAGVNVIMPLIMVIGGVGFMFGTGGSALSSKLLGMQDKEGANKVFTMILKTCTYVGIIISILGYFFVKPVAEFLGSLSSDTTQAMIEEAITYGRILSLGQVFFMTQNLFQSYFVVDEKPKLGFIYTIFAGVTNMILDWLLIKVLGMGVVGAALGTIFGQIVGSVFPFIHFLINKDGNINLVKTKLELKPILQSCFNGSSEFVSNISSSIVGFVYNVQLIKYLGQDGVSAYGTLMYVSFIFVAIYIGFSIGMAPVVGYNYGAGNKDELKSVLKKNLIIIMILSVLMFISSELFGPAFSSLYLNSDAKLLELTTKAFRIYSIHFLLCGLGIYISSFFTALNNGLISAVISFSRTILFQITFLIVFPLIFGADGIWWSCIGSETAALILSLIFLATNRKKYGY